MKYDPKTVDRREFTFCGESFEFPWIYQETESHHLTDGEAYHLNQLMKENITNNLRDTVNEMMEKGDSIEAIQSTIDQAYTVYRFVAKGDSVEVEMAKIGKGVIRAKLAKTGGDKSKDIVDALYAKNLPRYESTWRKAAIELIESRKRAANMADVDLVLEDDGDEDTES